MNLDHLEALLAKADPTHRPWRGRLSMTEAAFVAAIVAAWPELLAAARERDRLRGAISRVLYGDEAIVHLDHSGWTDHEGNSLDDVIAPLAELVPHICHALNPEPKP